MLLGFKTLDRAAGGKLGGLRVRAVFSFLFLTLVLFFERGRVTGVFKAQVCSLARPSWDLMNCKQSSLGPFPLLDEARGPGCGARWELCAWEVWSRCLGGACSRPACAALSWDFLLPEHLPRRGGSLVVL